MSSVFDSSLCISWRNQREIIDYELCRPIVHNYGRDIDSYRGYFYLLIGIEFQTFEMHAVFDLLLEQSLFLVSILRSNIRAVTGAWIFLPLQDKVIRAYWVRWALLPFQGTGFISSNATRLQPGNGHKVKCVWHVMSMPWAICHDISIQTSVSWIMCRSTEWLCIQGILDHLVILDQRLLC